LIDNIDDDWKLLKENYIKEGSVNACAISCEEVWLHKVLKNYVMIDKEPGRSKLVMM